MTDLGCVAGPSFTEEQRRRFQLRYKKGFDVPGDMDYISWLRLNRPDFPLLSRPTVAQSCATSGDLILDHFSEVSPLAEIPIVSTVSEATITTPSASTISKLLVPPQASTPSGRESLHVQSL